MVTKTEAEMIVGDITKTIGPCIVDNGVYYNGQQIGFLGETMTNGWVMEMFDPYIINSITMQMVNSRLLRLNRLWADGDRAKLKIASE